VAIALVVMSAAGLVTRSIQKLNQVDLAFDPSGLLIGELALRYDQLDDREKQLALIHGLMARIGTTPGVAAVTPVLAVPFSGSGGWDGRLPVDGETPAEAATRPMLNLEAVAPNYFTTLGVRILRGHAFTDDDGRNAAAVVIVSQSAADAYWPNVDALGRRFKSASGQLLTVVGIVPDTRYRDLRQARPSLYAPLEQSWFSLPLTFAIRATGEPAKLVPAIRRAVADVDPNVSLVRATPFDELLLQPRAQPRLNALLLSGFAFAAAVLASIGLLAVMATMVRHRKREMAVRQALGATPADVARLVLGRAMVITAAGALLGLAAALATNRLLAAMLFEVTPSDPVTLAGALLLIVAAAVVAVAVLVASSVRIQPNVALRTD
jgi:predicted permease